MKVFTFDSHEKGLITYKDKKRYLWMLSLVYPLYPLPALYLYTFVPETWVLWLPIIIAYGIVPVIDWASGQDQSNPPEEVVPQLEQDSYYQRLLYCAVPLHFVTFFVCAYWIAMYDLTALGYLAVSLGAGSSAGLGINTAHELGHKSDIIGRTLAKIVLAVPVYGHFCLEHNAGHHVEVATPEDPASSRMGENIYRFALREIPGGFKRGWNLEKRRLHAQGKSVWSTNNDILQSYALSAFMHITLIIFIGWYIVPFLLIQSAFAWWQLTSANYIEHYGLLRAKKENGKYARCEPYHSWNSNHVFSNLLLFHLERHSDHHAYPTRHYQSLRHFENLPSLPNGYFGSYILAYIPWLWYKLMDPKLLNLEHIQGDLSKINMYEPERERIKKNYAHLIKS